MKTAPDTDNKRQEQNHCKCKWNDFLPVANICVMCTDLKAKEKVIW